MVLLRCLAAVWLVAGTLVFRDIELRVLSLPTGLLLATLETLPASVGLAWPARWLVGAGRVPSLGLALRWAIVASLIGLAAPLVLGAVQLSFAGSWFRVAQGLALCLLLADGEQA